MRMTNDFSVGVSRMPVHPLAGKPAPKELLIDVARLERDYFERRPDPADPNQQVSFGTSGHRGTSLNGTFTEAHILAITQAICDYRRQQNIDGPVYMGKDTHALSAPTQRTALEVFAANGTDTIIDPYNGTGKKVIQFNALQEFQRCALSLENGTLYVAWASHNDATVVTAFLPEAVSSFLGFRPRA